MMTRNPGERRAADPGAYSVRHLWRRLVWSGRVAVTGLRGPLLDPKGAPLRASADYVARLMTEAGYNVTIQTYKFFYFAYTGRPAFSEISPTAHDYALTGEWNPGQSRGTTTADLQPAGGIIIPPTPTPSSSSGCTTADFSGFVPGRIALIQAVPATSG
jgi:hypothetical protein